ncbi:hypothetical protein ABMA28_011407 [Loxostege sticticalis]|uniref:Uncharacterized protein n=1 Tax=Loxostege sticticalis TaxID=481309 RepID=A0ABD0S663_LOXSC
MIFGIVCGQRFNGWEYEMRQFEDACDLINANCINPFETKKDRPVWYRGPWYVLYRGPCWELTSTWIWLKTNATALLSRAEYYVSKVVYYKDLSTYPK